MGLWGILSGMRSAYLIIAHGSRERQSNRAFLELVEKFQKAFPQRKVAGAFLELAKPSIPAGIAQCLQSRATEIFVIPFMLFPGRHVKEHIPQFIEEARAKYNTVDFHYAGPLSDGPGLLRILEEKISEIRHQKSNGKKSKRKR